MGDSGLTARVRRRVRLDFPERHDQALNALEAVHSGNQDRERVVAAVVLSAKRDLARLHQAVALSRLDWRDALVGGGLADEDWPQRLDAELGRD